MCAGIAREDERATFERILEKHPAGNVSVVSDTMNFWSVLGEILPALKDRIMAREGKLVIRPDSGDPADIVCGTRSNAKSLQTEEGKSPETDPAYFGAVQLLWNEFGGTINAAGFKELDPHIGLIYGDSITPARAKDITERLESLGFAASNIVFGVGSYTYQYVTRDTFSSAIKATWAQIEGEGYDLLKDPVTDSGMKKSATGRLAVKRDDQGELYLVERASVQDEAESLLEPVWKDGEFLKIQSFKDVRTVLGNIA